MANGNGNGLANKIVWFVVGSLLMVLIQISWHGVTVAYAQKDRVTKLETILPRIEDNLDEVKQMLKDHCEKAERNT